ncbi:MAG: alpha/beta hydrolase-fold protein [Cyclobacteriaceae bacterium]
MKAIYHLLLSLFIIASFGFSSQGSTSGLSFSLSFPEELSEGPLTGRMFVCIAREDEREPRLQVGRYGVQVFGQDFENLSAGSQVEITNETLGYPIEWLKDLPKGTYFIQAVVSKYTEFKRADGHTIWLHNDQWEGQNWRRSPGNLYSDVMKVTIDPGEDRTIELVANNEIPPIEVPEDTEWVKRIKIQSDILTEFWGQPMYLGATILLPKGYEDNPDAYYPTIYQQGHFSLRPPMRFQEDPENELYQSWTSDEFPRFLAVTIQHPTPYFDDSYAVNSVNNGPYGDAIHQELIPKIEQEFRTISKSWARLLTGGSTGGWESFALQVLYPDFYGGTWSFAPDPLDFRNVEGINIYEDENAFYKQHEWYRVPTINTRNPETAEAVLTSEQRNRMELVNGTKGRSGQQLDIWSAVYGPIGDDGYFKPLFNKRTGEMDSTVAEYWKENFDLRYYLEKNWSEVGPKLVGKLNIITGHMDNFYLNQGVYHMEEFLESTKNPYYNGTVTYGPKQKGHSWRPYSQVELIYKMAEHIEKNRPAGTLEKY